MGKSEYYAWVNMRQRCSNRSNPEYVRYGGRGIRVCDRWGRYSNFLADMGTKKSPELSLERKNNSLGYFPDNCVWEGKAMQSFNQRVSSDNRTGITGVYFEKQTSRWKAYIRVEGSQITLGRYTDFFEACCRRKSAEIKYYMENKDV